MSELVGWVIGTVFGWTINLIVYLCEASIPKDPPSGIDTSSSVERES